MKTGKSSSAALIKKIQRLAARADDGSLELAEALYDARALPKTTRSGPPSFADLVEITRLSRRTVHYLIAIWERFEGLNIPPDRLARVGWTKLAVIAGLCEPGEELKALDVAETHTIKELPAVLKGTPMKAKARTILFRLTPKQHTQFELVLLAHGAEHPKKGRGLVRKEAALMRALSQIAR